MHLIKIIEYYIDIDIHSQLDYYINVKKNALLHDINENDSQHDSKEEIK